MLTTRDEVHDKISALPSSEEDDTQQESLASKASRDAW